MSAFAIAELPQESWVRTCVTSHLSRLASERVMSTVVPPLLSMESKIVRVGYVVVLGEEEEGKACKSHFEPPIDTEHESLALLLQ